MKVTYNSNSEHIKFLMSQDSTLCPIINTILPLEIELCCNRFEALTRSIIGQQLSIKAAQSVSRRFASLFETISPSTVCSIECSTIASVGLSRAKARYVHELALGIVAGRVSLDDVDDMPDEYAINVLSRIYGVGRWTSEMFLIFSLGRENVFAFDDAGLRKAIALIYHLDNPSYDVIKVIADVWSPYRSIASLVLWKALDQGVI